MPGNRHDVRGLYALLETEFSGTLLGDNAYWPRKEKREELLRHGIEVVAESRSNWKFQYPKITRAWLNTLRGRAAGGRTSSDGVGGRVERRIGLFDGQMNAGATRNRNPRRLLGRRWTFVRGSQLLPAHERRPACR